MELGYALSSEEHSPADLVRHARLAEDAGFGFVNEHVLGARWPAPDERLEMLDEAVEAGPDADEYLDELKEYDQAGYTHVYVHQVGPDQEGFLEFAKSELLPRV